MTGSFRYVLAACFVALFFLVPSADHGRLAFLKTRAWLMSDDVLGNAEVLAEDAAVPPLAVDLIEQGADDAVVADRSASYARAPREWARGNGRELDDAATPLLLSVRVGENGFRSTLSAGRDGSWDERARLELQRSGAEAEAAGTYYPDRFSLIPAFLAIILAILTGRVVPSLLLGCLAGAITFTRLDPLAGVGHFVAHTVWADVLRDTFSLKIIGFVVFLFMCMGVMTRSGGIQGMVEVVRRFARGPISSQICSYVIGLLIFFDDYSNCIITGSTMRPLTDRNGVSREKLSYIVDSTAAPIAGVSIFSTWVAYEVSMFAPQLPEVTRADGVPYAQNEGFTVFIETLPFRFYCLFTLAMVVLTIVTRREFGTMLTAERRAWSEGKPVADDAQPMLSEGMTKIEPPPDAPKRALNAFLPIGWLIVATLALIFWFGREAAQPGMSLGEQLRAILNNTDSTLALLVASASAFALATILAVGQRILSLGDALLAALRSARALLFAIVILILAWSIGSTCRDLGTAQYLTAAFHGAFSPWLLPVVMFLLASLVAFSTGTSYGTMAILLPNVVVLAHSMGASVPDLGGPALMVLTIGAVLEGSIFGDHCSPISDTTVLSSVSTASDHLHHVRTQAPYAVAVMIVSIVCGYIPAALWGPDVWLVTWGLGFGALLAILFVVGKPPRIGPAATPAGEPATPAG